MNKRYPAAHFLALALLVLFLCAFTDRGQFPELKGYKNTMNFTVWAPTQKKAGAVAKELEKYYHGFLSDLKYGGMLKKKPEVYVFKNYEEYVDKTGKLGYNTSHTGGIAVPRSARKPAKIYFFTGNQLVVVLRHELTHILFKEITAGQKIDARIPIWLNEGVAVYESGDKRYRERAETALKAGNVIPVPELLSYTSYPEGMDKVSLFYAQSASLVDFLLKRYGGVKFRAFSGKLIRGGKNINEALSSTYYPHIRDISQLNEAWQDFLNSQ